MPEIIVTRPNLYKRDRNGVEQKVPVGTRFNHKGEIPPSWVNKVEVLDDRRFEVGSPEGEGNHTPPPPPPAPRDEETVRAEYQEVFGKKAGNMTVENMEEKIREERGK